MNSDAVTLCLTPNSFDDAGDRRIVEVREVHRDLRASINEQTETLDVTQTAGGMANGFGNFLGDADIIGGEINVEGDQRIARTDDSGSGCAKLRGSKIGGAVRIGFNFSFETFVLSLADIFEIGTLETRCRRFI